MENLGSKVKLTALVVGLGVVAALYWWIFAEGEAEGGRDASAPETRVDSDAAARRAAEAELRDEAKVKDVRWAGRRLYVGVVDDGSGRDRDAQHVCEVLRNAGVAPGVTVVIKDIATFSRDDHVALGEARC